MKISAKFIDGFCRLYLVPSDDWEGKLLGAIAKGGENLKATVTYESKGHPSYGDCKAIEVILHKEEEENARRT